MKSGFQVFDIVQPIGMFATLTYCALLAKACEEKGIEPYIVASSPYYLSPGRGNDWFDYFFAHNRIQLTSQDVAALRRDNHVVVIRERNHINEFARGLSDREISNDFSCFSEATRLFGKYFHIEPHMSNYVGEFVARNFDSTGQLGIHYRGTDHHHEYEFVEKVSLLDAVSEHFGKYRSIFIATDEQEFLDFARSHMRDKRIITLMPAPPKSHRIDEGDNYQKGFRALADCLLLSRCQALVKTPSALSTWSKVFGPDMDVVLVGKPYSNPYKRRWSNLKGLGYFPESLLYRWDSATMAQNRVIKIIAKRPRPKSPRLE